MLTRAAALAALAVAVAIGGGVAPAAADAQAGYLADWADLSTWSRTNPDTKQVEHGLGLVLDGPSGAMRLALFVTDPPRGRPRFARPVGVRVAAGPRVNPNVIRTATLKFTARVARPDAAAPRDVVIDASSGLTVDNPAPGAVITSAAGTLPQGALQTLAEASALSAEVLGVPVTFRDDQRAAIRAFRDRVAKLSKSSVQKRSP